MSNYQKRKDEALRDRLAMAAVIASLTQSMGYLSDEDLARIAASETTRDLFVVIVWERRTREKLAIKHVLGAQKEGEASGDHIRQVYFPGAQIKELEEEYGQRFQLPALKDMS